jgi:hypothetical protein
MRATTLLVLLIFGIAAILVAPAVTTGQFGKKGGGKKGMDPDILFDMLARGRPSIPISEIRFGASQAAKYAQDKGITNGTLTRQQFIEFQEQITIARGQFFPPGGGTESKLKELLKERLATTRELAKQVTQRLKKIQGRPEEQLEATRLMFEAELDVCDSDKERIAVLEKFLASAKDNEKIAMQLHKTGEAAETTALGAKAERLRVEIALERAKAKAAVKPARANAAQELQDQVALAEKHVAIKRAAVKIAELQKKTVAAKLATSKSLVVETRNFELYREKQHKRIQELSQQGVVEERLVEESRIQWEAAKARRVTAEGSVSECESQVALEQAHIELAQLELEEAELRMNQLRARLRPER